jgi:hypothetical protein
MNQKIFGERAKSYTTSAAHADEYVLARILELAVPWLLGGSRGSRAGGARRRMADYVTLTGPPDGVPAAGGW